MTMVMPVPVTDLSEVDPDCICLHTHDGAGYVRAPRKGCRVHWPVHDDAVSLTGVTRGRTRERKFRTSLR